MTDGTQHAKQIFKTVMESWVLPAFEYTFKKFNTNIIIHQKAPKRKLHMRVYLSIRQSGKKIKKLYTKIDPSTLVWKKSAYFGEKRLLVVKGLSTQKYVTININVQSFPL